MVAETSYQMLELLSFCPESGGRLTSFNKGNRADFFLMKNKSKMKLSGVSIFLEYVEKL